MKIRILGLFHCISCWPKTKFFVLIIIAVLSIQKEKLPSCLSFFFELQQQLKQRNFVFRFWFLVNSWCNETNIRYKISIAATSLRTNQIYIRVYILWINLIFQVGHHGFKVQLFWEGQHFLKKSRPLCFDVNKWISNQLGDFINLFWPS